MKVFAHYYKSEETGNDYRWRTILQFGMSWEIIGTVVMKNPGSAQPLSPVFDSITLEQLKKFSNDTEYAWYSFSSDNTMQNIGQLFCSYYKTSTLNGVIQIFNLMNVRDPNIELAITKNNNSIYPFSRTAESDVKFIVAPVYLGWGNLWNQPLFREDADLFFHVVQEQHNGKYLFPQIADNKLYHPQYLMGVGRNSPQSLFVLNAFCQNTTTPKMDTHIMPIKQISKSTVFEQVVSRLRKELRLKEEQPKTCRFLMTDELILTITCTGQGYVGIRHATYKGTYVLCNYPHTTKYRAFLSELGYNTSIDFWLGTKNFRNYDGDENSVVNNIISEIETIKKRI